MKDRLRDLPVNQGKSMETAKLLQKYIDDANPRAFQDFYDGLCQIGKKDFNGDIAGYFLEEGAVVISKGGEILYASFGSGATQTTSPKVEQNQDELSLEVQQMFDQLEQRGLVHVHYSTKSRRTLCLSKLPEVCRATGLTNLMHDSSLPEESDEGIYRLSTIGTY